ncbi:MAG: uroporphyrinogen-III C-methyltransferase [candidate division Zixibacteria bacterium]|nr:uroporphyrinogen-III C-methyltransferase [candidate division Zixibacteria bacterium]
MSDLIKGTVFLIGAGPGDPGLITVKGKRLLDTCDAVVYDNLVCPQLIVMLPESTEVHYVGKRAGDHPVPQDNINELLLKLAHEGKNVARLKGSDPLIFGRGGEEAKYLKEHGIKFEIVNGVTSGIAGPAYSGIPCTDREKASFVLFVTGHKASSKLKTSVPWDWVAKAKNGTVVIYMGVNQIKEISEQLLEFGMPADLPAAIVERGTFPSQRVFTTTLGELRAVAEKETIKPPALFVLGHVVELQPYLEWFTDRPLMGLRIMVTRTPHQAGELYERLRRLGAEPLPYPTIAIETFDDPDNWKKIADIKSDKKWIVFTSENGVRCFFTKMREYFEDIRQLGDFKIAAIGAGTAQELANNHLSADFIPSSATVAVLTKEMTEKLDLDGAAIVRVRGNLADDLLEKTVPAHGAEVIPLTVYRTYHPIWPDGLKEKVVEYPPHAILFTSGSTLEGLYHNLSDEEAQKVLKDAGIFSIGPKMTAKLKEHDLELTREAKIHTIDGMIDELLDYYKDKI